MKKYSAVIFDMDGTLLNTLEDLGDCMNRVLTRAGYAAHPIDDYRYFVGDGMVNLVQRVLPEQRRDELMIRQIQTAMVEEYGRHWADKTDLYPGVSALLDELTKREIKKGILSNKPHDFTKSQCFSHRLVNACRHQLIHCLACLSIACRANVRNIGRNCFKSRPCANKRGLIAPDHHRQ